MKKISIAVGIFVLIVITITVVVYLTRDTQRSDINISEYGSGQQSKEADTNGVISQENNEKDKSKGAHNAYYVDKSFYGNIESLRGTASNEKVYGGIISHHFLMAREISGLISSFTKQKPATIFVVGPNHFDAGTDNIIITEYDYNTPYGLLENDRELTAQLIANGAVKVNNFVFRKEHSTSTFVGFIKYFLPDTKIVPIALKRWTTTEERDALVTALIEIVPDDAIVLGSVDFSHHINATASEFHDNRTISIINNFDFDRLQSVEVDSPESLDVVLQYFKAKGAKKMKGYGTNMASRVEDEFLEDGTSYLFASFSSGSSRDEDKISVLSFGDMMLGRDVGRAIDKGIDPFDKILGVEGNFLRGVDIISANLEGPITSVDDCSTKKYSFKFKPSITKLLNKYKFNAVTLSNNHSFDCHTAGFEDTKKYLDEAGIFHFGGNDENKLKIKKIANKNIAFVGIDTTIHGQNSEKYKKIVAEGDKRSDFVVVNIHWGDEYSKKPNVRQIKLAHELVDAGADVIIGHHPHVVQSAEVYKNKAIFYSLGNFIFDQVGVEENKGLGVGVVFTEKQSEYYLFPYNIKRYHPELIDMHSAKVFCDEFLGDMGVKTDEICKFSLNNATEGY